MSRNTKIKEAIKTGLAFALVFGIAMHLGWMNPYWAGWAVAVIALPLATLFASAGSPFAEPIMG